ncbi:adhesion G-protein coupled receptor G2-like isoform X3 [Pygocentrus nattereri]|uniref:adhesion G-protein coupled receptor G2-like isoform X3 n=1 Tax=Pygocentrus nattereri TaxID=42514 RepID=UPI001891A1B1|nr:adhesion G-protein coupled receptor G2-like isoform X3 [Pygocentrus nattereri]
MVHLNLAGRNRSQWKLMDHVLLSVLVLVLLPLKGSGTTQTSMTTTSPTPGGSPAKTEVTNQTATSTSTAADTAMTATGSGTTQTSMTTTSPTPGGSPAKTEVTNQTATSTSTAADTAMTATGSGTTQTSMTTTSPTPGGSPAKTAVNYWMRISVNVSGHSEADITAWLKGLFQQHLGECRYITNATSATSSQMAFTSTTPPSETSDGTHSNTFSTTPDDFSSPSTQSATPSPAVQLQTQASGNSSVKENETTTSLFQNIEVMCDNKTAVRHTECTVLLQLSQPTSPCCIARIVSIVQVNSTIQGQVIGNQVQRVGKELCHSDATGSPAGSFEKNGSLNTEVLCNSNAAMHVLCSGDSENVTHNPVKSSSTCVPSPTDCMFSQDCSDYSRYYWMRMSVNVIGNVSEHNESKITAWVQSLFQQHGGECAFILKSSAASSSHLPFTTSESSSSAYSASWGTSLSSAPSTQNVSTTNENTTSLFQDIDVICYKTSIGCTECTVLLRLSRPTSPCCIACIISAVQMNSTLQGQVLEMRKEAVTAEDLLKQSKNGSALNSTQVKWIVFWLETLLSGPNVTLELGNISINIVSSLLDASAQMLSSCSNRIIRTVDAVGLKLEELGQNKTILSPYVALAVVRVNGTDFPNTSFTVNSSNLQINFDSLSWSVNNTAFPLQGSIILPSTLLSKISMDEKKQASRIQFHFYQKSSLFQDQEPNSLISGVLGCSVANLSISNLTDNVTITLRKTEPVSNDSSVSCVFWNFSLNSGSGGWSSEGCTVMSSTETETVCSCNHLTSFALRNRRGSTNLTNEDLAEGLLNQARDASALNSAQVQRIVSELELLVSGPEVSQTLGSTSINIVSNLLAAAPAALASTASRIVEIVDRVGLKLVVNGQNKTILSPSVALAVKMVNGTVFEQTSFTLTDSSTLQIDGDSVSRMSVLPPQGSIVLPASLMANLTSQQQKLASRVQFSFYQKSTLFQDKALKSEHWLVSGVLGCSVANLSISDLRENVTIILRNTEPVPADSSVSCVFWKSSLNSGSGGWSSEGCTVLNRTANETVCRCNHLTSFGVLLGHGTPSIILTFITNIGCGISATFLSLTLITYLVFEELRVDIPSKILIQFCLALLLLNLVFLLDSDLAQKLSKAGLCITTAFFLHYFTLASFTWMALQAVHMYLTIVKVFNTYFSRFMIKLGLVGWGIPLVVVITVLAINKDFYGLRSYGKLEDGSMDYFCWFKMDEAFYAAVMSYFCVTYLLSFSMFVVVMVLMCRIRSQNPHYVRKRTFMQDFRGVTALLVFLGLTWGFAFFAWGPVNLAFMYLFSICNSLQGFFIFVFYCAAKANVRNQWRTYLCCADCSLQGISERMHKVFSGVPFISSSRPKMSFSTPKTLHSGPEGSRQSISLHPRNEHAETLTTVVPSSDCAGWH